ncbi:nuclear mRNA export, poly(A)+RNA binding protein [Irineochytrium annulatum]|nr:nuclear mRNA export, poly(A)+RNA binding protein [Irineochytrium annulatum]
MNPMGGFPIVPAPAPGGMGGGFRGGRGRGRRGGHHQGQDHAQMDIVGAAGGGNRGRKVTSTPYGSGRPRPNVPVEITVRNWKGNDDVNVLFEFLRGKASGQFTILNHRLAGNNQDLIIKVPNQNQADMLAQLSGIRYAGNKLNITILRGGPRLAAIIVPPRPAVSSYTPQVLEALKGVLLRLYNRDVKFLNLEALEKDPVMSSTPALSGFGSDQAETAKLGPAICRLIGEVVPDVQTISFKSNKLQSLVPLMGLGNNATFLQNLSFEDNLIQTYSELKRLNGENMQNLRELYLLGNTVRDREMKRNGGEAKYRRAMSSGWHYVIMNDALTVRLVPERLPWMGSDVDPLSARATEEPLLGRVVSSVPHNSRQRGNSIMGGAGPAGGIMSLGAPPVVAGGGTMSLGAPPVVAGGALPDENGLQMLKNALGMNDQQHEMIVQFAHQTGLNYQFALQCLNETKWVWAAAVDAFNTARPSIPPQAFQLQL